ncbi:MAG TPA: hypothetical protein VFW07_16215 [Parafilimonas sp.]|nr:hypothetical protein [Parafilimonas sp.]
MNKTIIIARIIPAATMLRLYVPTLSLPTDKSKAQVESYSDGLSLTYPDDNE